MNAELRLIKPAAETPAQVAHDRLRQAARDGYDQGYIAGERAGNLARDRADGGPRSAPAGGALVSRATCTPSEAARALSDNRELYFEQSAATRNGYVPRISPWRTAPACQVVAIESHPLHQQGESSSDARARHS